MNIKATDSVAELLERITVVHARCPEMRVGQLIATAATLAEDETGRPLWDLEDAELLAALDRLATDLARRAGQAAAD